MTNLVQTKRQSSGFLTSVGGGRVDGGDITQLVQPSVLHHKGSGVSHVKALHGTRGPLPMCTNQNAFIEHSQRTIKVISGEIMKAQQVGSGVVA